MSPTNPSFIGLFEDGKLEDRAEKAAALLLSCSVCPHNCGVDRTAGKLGVCRTGALARVSSYGPHMGEEDPLRGWRGSGTIFFSSCNLRCQYCQNYDISQGGYGQEVEPDNLARMMLELQSAGCHNINFVSPTHVVPQIIAAVLVAAGAGLNIPLVYNTGGYDSVETLKLLDGIIDIYMPDMKYASASTGLHYSKIKDYPRHNQAAVEEMHRQVGDLLINQDGLAVRGLLVRHLILPNGLAGTEEIASFLAEKVSKDTYLNLMDQYRPEYNARQHQKLNRSLRSGEFQAAVQAARQAGLHRFDERKRFWW
jgi:putative pyruvate formate lyase activating enzyme